MSTKHPKNVSTNVQYEATREKTVQVDALTCHSGHDLSPSVVVGWCSGKGWDQRLTWRRTLPAELVRGGGGYFHQNENYIVIFRLALEEVLFCIKDI